MSRSIVSPPSAVRSIASALPITPSSNCGVRFSSCSSEITCPPLSNKVEPEADTAEPDAEFAKTSSSGTNRLSGSAVTESLVDVPASATVKVPALDSVKLTSLPISLPVISLSANDSATTTAAVVAAPTPTASVKSICTPPLSATPLPMVGLKSVTVVEPEVEVPESASVVGFKSTVYSLTSLTLPGASTSMRKFKKGSSTGPSLVIFTTAFPSGRRSTAKTTDDKTGNCSSPARANASDDASCTRKSRSSSSVADRISISASSD